MSERVTTDLDDDERPVARKRSRSTADAVRLANEAAVLAVARHPGVVELLRTVTAEDGSVELITAFSGAHSLDTCGPLPLAQAAGLVAAVAETVADLHAMGIVHGRIEPSHVVLGPHGQPVLCGFAGAGQAGTVPPASPQPPPDFCDPAATSGTPLQPATDVFGIGALLRTLVLDDGNDMEPIPDRRWSFARWQRPWAGYHRRALLMLADQATDDEPRRRPPARRLAGAIREALPAARLGPVPDGAGRNEAVFVEPGDHDDPFAALRPAPDSEQRDKLGRRAVPLVAAGVGLALFVFGMSSLQGGGDAAAPTTGPIAAETAPLSREPDATPTSALPPVGCPPLAGANVGDRNGDGCPDAARVDGDGIVVVGTVRFGVGSPGDLVALGDWDCDGRATPALLRPATGEVFVFTDWASAGADVEVEAITSVAGGVGVVGREGADGCSTLVVSTSGGEQVEVAL